MRFFLIIISVVLSCFLSRSASFGNEEISKEDLEIIKNLELLEELEIVQSEDMNLIESYEDVSQIDGGEGYESKTIR